MKKLVKTASYTDTSLDELSMIDYGVAAVNFHGTEGPVVTITVVVPEGPADAGLGGAPDGPDEGRQRS